MTGIFGTTSGFMLVRLVSLDDVNLGSCHCVLRYKDQCMRSGVGNSRGTSIQFQSGEDFFFLLGKDESTVMLEIYDEQNDSMPISSAFMDVLDNSNFSAANPTLSRARLNTEPNVSTITVSPVRDQSNSGPPMPPPLPATLNGDDPLPTRKRRLSMRGLGSVSGPLPGTSTSADASPKCSPRKNQSYDPVGKSGKRPPPRPVRKQSTKRQVEKRPSLEEGEGDAGISRQEEAALEPGRLEEEAIVSVSKGKYSRVKRKSLSTMISVVQKGEGQSASIFEQLASAYGSSPPPSAANSGPPVRVHRSTTDAELPPSLIGAELNMVGGRNRVFSAVDKSSPDRITPENTTKTQTRNRSFSVFENEDDENEESDAATVSKAEVVKQRRRGVSFSSNHTVAKIITPSCTGGEGCPCPNCVALGDGVDSASCSGDKRKGSYSGTSSSSSSVTVSPRNKDSNITSLTNSEENNPVVSDGLKGKFIKQNAMAPGNTVSAHRSMSTSSVKRLRDGKEEAGILDPTQNEWLDARFALASGKGSIHVKILSRPFSLPSANGDEAGDGEVQKMERQKTSLCLKQLGRYGFVESDLLVRDPEYEQWLKAYFVKENKKALKWWPLVKNGFTHSQLKGFARRGVPPTLRPRSWRFCLPPKKESEMRGYYFVQLVKFEMEGKANFSTDQIERDLLRTFPSHPLYTSKEGISSLRRVLTAFSVHNRVVGYCQSMNFVCGILLLFLNEEDAFWVLAHIVENLASEFYSPDLIGVKTDAQVVVLYAQEKFPKLMNHVAALEIRLQDFVSRWFLQLFVNVLPTETVLRVFDVFLLEGSKSLVRIALAILKVNEPNILACGTMEELWKFMETAGATMYDADHLFDVAWSKKYVGKLSGYPELRQKTIKRLRQHAFNFVVEVVTKESILSKPELNKVLKYVQAISGRTTRLDRDHFTRLITKIWANAISKEFVDHMFNALRTQHEQTAHLQQAINLVAILAKGSDEQKLRFFFDLFDDDKDGSLTILQTNFVLMALFGLMDKEPTGTSANVRKSIARVSVAVDKVTYDGMLNMLTTDDFGVLTQVFSLLNRELT